MTCGDDLCGDSLCGEDDVSLLFARAPIPRGAPFFDGTTRDFPVDDDGRHTDIHWIDSAVQMALLVEAQRIATAPQTGQTYRQIVLGPKLQSDVENRTRTALEHLVKTGAVEILDIKYRQPNRHALFVAVWYRNLETQIEEVATARAG